MSIQIARRLFTTEEYHKMAEVGIIQERRLELIKGEIIKMSPIGSKHAACVDRVCAFLQRQNKDNYLVKGQNPVLLDKFTEPEPDICLVKPKDNFYADRHPQPGEIYLIIEVADSSLAYDREIKLALYAENNIPEYWILDLENECVEMHQRPSGKIYKTRKLLQNDDRAEQPELGISLVVKDLYK